MHVSQRALAASLVLALAVTACSGHSSLPGVSGSNPAGTESSLRSSVPSTPMISIPKTYGALAFTDMGRRSATAPVNVTLTLRYNNQAQLDQFVASQSAPGAVRHFLTPAAFNNEYAPTVQQEQSVETALQRAGFTVTHTYPNRTIVDASAPSATVERFFSTQMHTVMQGKYGQRYANLTPATVPSAIASYIRAASLSDVVIAQTQVDQDGGVIRNPQNLVVAMPKPHNPGNAQEAPAYERIAASGCSGQLLLNPGFESGDVDWSDPNGDIFNYAPYAYQGNWFTWIDGYSSPTTDPGITQTVSIPAGCTATLSYYLFVGSNAPKRAIDYFYVNVNGPRVQSFNNTTTDADADGKADRDADRRTNPDADRCPDCDAGKRLHGRRGSKRTALEFERHAGYGRGQTLRLPGAARLQWCGLYRGRHHRRSGQHQLRAQFPLGGRRDPDRHEHQ